MLDFHVEWHDAPGVKDQVLARTWARLEIRLDPGPASTQSLTYCVRARSNSVQDGVYGPVFPLAEWIVENWWFLLAEPLRVQEYRGGRDMASVSALRSWVQRHDLTAAREGGALPDLTLYRDGPDVVACWFPDPAFDDRIRPTRFINPAGSVRLAPSQLEDSLGRFVEAVLERLDRESDDDTRRLRANWQAVLESRDREADLCLWSAALGLDAYDPDQLSDELVALLEDGVAAQPAALRNDLLEASSARTLADDLQWTSHASSRLARIRGMADGGRTAGPDHRPGLTAAEAGYHSAAGFRADFDIPARPLDDLDVLLHTRCGWPEDPEIIVEGRSSGHRLAMVGQDEQGRPRFVVGARPAREASRRFGLARAVYFLPSADSPPTQRLVTRAFGWDQRASRAFAAELLAPAAALRSSVGDHTSADAIDELASEFKVSTWVIGHQIINHRLGWIDEDG